MLALSRINVLEGHAGPSSFGDGGRDNSRCSVRPIDGFPSGKRSISQAAVPRGPSSSFAGVQQPCRLRMVFFQVGVLPPTRLNTADDPTRRVKIREAAKRSFLPFFSARDLQLIHASQLKRFAANWIRLVLLLACAQPAAASNSLPSIPRLLWPCLQPSSDWFWIFPSWFQIPLA